MANKKFPAGTIFLFSLFLLVMLVTYILVKPSPPPSDLIGVLRPDLRSLHPFELTDHNNAVFNLERFEGKWSFVFFGYTSCPDICPTTLHVLNSVHGKLADEGKGDETDTQVIFISVDPERDDTEKLASYMSYFNEKFIGVTSDKEKIDKLVRQFGAGYALEPETSPDNYLVAHTSAIFLVDPFGRLVATFSQPHYPATINTLYDKIRTYFQQ